MNGITIGMTYALIAVGYSLVFGILRLVNFSHGSVYAFGANSILFLISLNFGIVPSILTGILITGILGVIVDKTALEPLRKKSTEGITSCTVSVWPRTTG